LHPLKRPLTNIEERMLGNVRTLSELLHERAQSFPDLPLYRYLEDNESPSGLLTAGQLLQDSLAIGNRLSEVCRPRDRVLLLAPPGLDFIRGFFGIQQAGLIGTTSPPPHPNRIEKKIERLQSIVESCEPKIAIVTSKFLPLAERLGLPWLNIETLESSDSKPMTVKFSDSSATAFLQYTSGSTSEPRGVMLSHGNLLDNLRFISKRFNHHRGSCGVIWLPPYHDMGLIGGILQPLFVGFPVILLNPLHVLQRPLRWLKAITEYSATTSGGPNFIFEHCVDSITDEEKQLLDLSSWEVAFCGAETIRPKTWRRFSDAFAGCGFRREAFFPCYGLAEASLMVTSSTAMSLPKSSIYRSPTEPATTSTMEYMSCGTSDPQHQVLIVDPETKRIQIDGTVGEIWVAGPSVAKGYWNAPESTVAVFDARLEDSSESFLRTGDLGFVYADELYITGRSKELIIREGRNFYPQDLEVAIEESSSIFQPNGACIFSVPGETTERLIAVVEIYPRFRKLTSPQQKECATAARRALSERFELPYDELWLVKTGSIPRTSSGKKRRGLCRELYTTKKLQNEEICLAADGVSNRSQGIHQANISAQRLQQRLALAMVITPMLGLMVAVWLAWGRGIHAIDLTWLIGLYIATVLGVEVGFHRLFSHRSFQTTPWVRSVLCILGSMAAQGPVLFWVATHRRHHAFSDQERDPHSPVPLKPGRWATIQGLWHAHLGWLFRSELTSPIEYAPDVLRDPLLFKLNQRYPWWVLLGLIVPGLGSFLVTGTGIGFAQGVLWGGLVRILCVHHATWSVNSLCHVFGSRDFDTRDESRNNPWLVLTSLGGSWHNNHHAHPNAAFTGIRPWQIDPSGWVIRGLALLGLAWDIKTPARRVKPSSNEASGTAMQHQN
jgi:acyl-CoA synthetase (AMP-forming)/AMP-acid ligase II/fatty-acid desaturase